jgi:hypothetical protein
MVFLIIKLLGDFSSKITQKLFFMLNSYGQVW